MPFLDMRSENPLCAPRILSPPLPSNSHAKIASAAPDASHNAFTLPSYGVSLLMSWHLGQRSALSMSQENAGLTHGLCPALHDRLSKDRTECPLRRVCYARQARGSRGTRAPCLCLHACVRGGIPFAPLAQQGHALSAPLRTRPGCEGMTTMPLSIIKELTDHEHRVACTPAGAKA
jgi:hypothetical protein